MYVKHNSRGPNEFSLSNAPLGYQISNFPLQVIRVIFSAMSTVLGIGDPGPHVCLDFPDLVRISLVSRLMHDYRYLTFLKAKAFFF